MPYSRVLIEIAIADIADRAIAQLPFRAFFSGETLSLSFFSASAGWKAEQHRAIQINIGNECR
jgi:hypothetical protein